MVDAGGHLTLDVEPFQPVLRQLLPHVLVRLACERVVNQGGVNQSVGAFVSWCRSVLRTKYIQHLAHIGNKFEGNGHIPECNK